MVGEARKYRIIEALWKGGFGTVYSAELIGSGGFRKPVALKILNADVAGAEEIVSRLRDEARMLGLLRHPGIVLADDRQALQSRLSLSREVRAKAPRGDDGAFADRGARRDDRLERVRTPHARHGAPRSPGVAWDDARLRSTGTPDRPTSQVVLPRSRASNSRHEVNSRPDAPGNRAHSPNGPCNRTGLREGWEEKVTLIRGAERHVVDEVPAGSYTIEARFPGRGIVTDGRVSVLAGQVVTLTCDASFALCRSGP